MSAPQQPGQPPQQYGYYPPQPPGQYGYYPPPGYQWLPPGYPVPGRYPPPPQRHSGTGILVTAIVLGALAAAGLLLTILVGNDVSACNSGLGQVAQAFSQQTASTCSHVDLAHTALELVTAVLGIGCLAAAIDYIRR